MTGTSRIAKARRQLQLEWHAVEEIRDLLRVQLHLGSMEIKDAWRDLEVRRSLAALRATRRGKNG